MKFSHLDKVQIYLINAPPHFTPPHPSKVSHLEKTGHSKQYSRLETLSKQHSTATLENSSTVSLKTKQQLPYDLAISLLGIYPREIKTRVHRKPIHEYFIAALFVITKNWKQTRYPSMGKQLNKLIQNNTTQ